MAALDVSRQADLEASETERSILMVAPDAEGLDWICYRVRGGVDPCDTGASARPSENRFGRCPERDLIEAALRRLVSRGLLTYERQRWSMTPKGLAAR